MQLDKLRQQLAIPKISIQLCVLALLAGICASIVIIIFRWSIENIQTLYLDSPDNFSSLSAEGRLLLPLIGISIIILIAKITKFKHQRTGIPFVMYRMKNFYGMMPFKNTLNQFFAGIASLSTGFSVGREGPSVHLGAASTSFIASWLQLPYNSVRTLTACGIAAGISASFNTPLAAVIFVMEVVLREYKTHIFVPVMLASFSGSVLTRLVFGNDHGLSNLDVMVLDASHYPYLVFMGLALGAFAFAFNRQLIELLRSVKHVNMIHRLLIAALITSIIGYFVPEALGVSFGTLNLAELGMENSSLLIIIFVSKALLTFFAIGLGIPGGLIGPIMALGLIFGIILAVLGSVFLGDYQIHAEMYGVLGLAGLMAATLNAPLAALITALELTHSPDIILPAMLVIVTAHVIASQFFRNRSVFILQLEFQKLDYQSPPAYEALQKIGILSTMNKNFVLVESDDTETLRQALDRAGKRPVILKQNTEQNPSFKLVEYDVSLDPNNASPFRFEELQGVESRYTLVEPFEILNAKRRGSVFVFEHSLGNIIGVINWEQIRAKLIKGTL